VYNGLCGSAWLRAAGIGLLVGDNLDQMLSLTTTTDSYGQQHRCTVHSAPAVVVVVFLCISSLSSLLHVVRRHTRLYAVHFRVSTELCY